MGYLGYRTSYAIGRLPYEIAFDLFRLALSEASRRAELRRKRRAPKRGLTLQPGPDTPLWNELVRQALPHLRERGSKAQLGRMLGLSRHRVHVCLKARRGCFDAERTLLLMLWLLARIHGRESVT